MVTDLAVRSTMRYRITAKPGYLKADLFNRQTAEETREFLSAVADECLQRRCYRVLISVHSSKPIFTVERYGLSSFIDLAMKHSGQFAVLADSRESRIAQEYVVMVARLRGVNVRAFRDEGLAAQWLKETRQ